MCNPKFTGRYSHRVNQPAHTTEHGAYQNSCTLSWGMTINDLAWPFIYYFCHPVACVSWQTHIENKTQATSGSIISNAFASSAIGVSFSALQS